MFNQRFSISFISVIGVDLSQWTSASLVTLAVQFAGQQANVAD